MTLCMAWIRDIGSSKQLILATDSMITGGIEYPYGTKLVVIEEKNCAICWEGDTTFTNAYIENIRTDLKYSDGLNDSSVPLFAIARRITKIFNQLWQANLNDKESMYKSVYTDLISTTGSTLLTKR